MLKRIITLVLVLSMLITATGCVGREKASEEQMCELAKTMTDLIAKGDLEAAYDASTVSLQYSKQYIVFQDTWNLNTDYCGEYVADMGLQATRWDSESTFLVDYGYDFSNIGVIIRVFFNEYGEMTSYSVRYNDFHDEYEMPAGIVEEEFSFVNVDGTTMHGAFCYPEGAENVPAVMLIPGSGALHMDSPYGHLKIMRDIAHGLAEQGIATLRMNKRTYENTQNDFISFCQELEFTRDYTMAYELLKTQPYVDADKLFILGHSVGGKIAARIDGELDSAGIIVLSGTNRPLWELHYDQNYNYVQVNGASSIDDLSNLEQERQKAVRLKNQTFLDAAEETIFNYNGFYYWEEMDTQPDLTLITKPVLLIRGLKDYQTYEEDWQSLLDGYANAQLVTKEFEGLGHMMTESDGSQNPSEYFHRLNVDEAVINTIAEFVKSN